MLTQSGPEAAFHAHQPKRLALFEKAPLQMMGIVVEAETM